MSLLFLVGALSFGLLISTLVQRQQDAFQIAGLTSMLPTILLSGFIFPIRSMPVALQVISHVVPARYYMSDPARDHPEGRARDGVSVGPARAVRLRGGGAVPRLHPPVRPEGVMFWRQVRHVFVKEFAQLRRNREALRILFIAPLIQTLAFGYAATTDIRDIPFVLVDQDHSPASRALIERFTGSGYFRLVGAEPTSDRVDDWLVRGKADLALVLARRLRARAARRKAAAGAAPGRRHRLQLLDARARPTRRRSSARNRRCAPPQLVPEGLPKPGQITVEPRVWYNPDLRSRWFMVPAVIAMVLMIVLMTLGAMAIVRERETGTMEQLIVTPLDPRALMIGKLAPYAGVGMIEVLLTTAIAVLWFRIPLRGSFVELIGLSFLFVLVVLAIGLLVSTMARTQQQAMMSSMFFIMTPMIYLSGFLFPIENMPAPIRAVTYFLPLRYFAEIVRGLFLKGAGLSTLWPNALALAVFAVGLTLLAARRFRKTLD